MSYKMNLVIFFLFLTKAVAQNKGNQDLGLYQFAAYPIGVAVSAQIFVKDSAYAAVVAKEFNSVTIENHLKMNAIRPCDTCWNYTLADSVVNWCLRNKKRVHGHTLLWHESFPKWLKKYNSKQDSAFVENVLKEHVMKTVKRYKGKIASWDVANEVIADKSTELRQSFWLTILGPNFLSRIIQYAKEADPDVKIFYNDYGQEYDYVKIEGIDKLLATLKFQNIKIDGIGFQMHTCIQSPSLDSIKNAIMHFAKQGYLIHISELDVPNYPKDGNKTMTDSMLRLQSERYKNIAAIYALVPQKQRFGITTWNLSDKDSWIRTYMKDELQKPLLFDEQYKRKPAYYGFREGLKISLKK